VKVLLVQPPVQDFYDTDIRLQPIGLCYLKAALHQHVPGLEVIIRDYHTGMGRKTVPVPKELGYLKRYYPVADKSPFSSFHQYYHFGLSFAEIEQDIAALNPDVVGISSLFTPYFREALEVANRAKAQLNVPVVMGGSHVSAVPDAVLSNPAVDYVIRGEGERPLVELINYLQGRLALTEVSNLGYKHAGQLVFNPVQNNYAIDDIPAPDLSQLPLRKYTLGTKPLAFMITSRSCPHKCTFCSVHTTFGKSYRRRRVDQVLQEIRQRYQQGYRVIDFEDDNLTYYKPEFKQLCQILIEEYPDRALELVAMNGISYLSLDDELLELMWQAGFSQLNLALVSSDNTVRNTTKRPHTLERYVNVVRKAKALGLSIVSYQILGLPSESLDSMVQTLVFNSRLPVLLGASPFYRIPNSPIAQGLALDEADYISARLTAMGVADTEVTRAHIYTLFIITRIINFLKGINPEHSTRLSELINVPWPDQRTQLGMQLLNKLFDEKTLYFSNNNGLTENELFKTDLFFQVIRQANTIGCLNGVSIDMSQVALKMEGINAA
jgi:radical SAM superfamily enzyme YgiQ (UPF0313 family)